MGSTIWMISASFYPHVGGGEQQLQRLSEQLIKNGWQVGVITRRHNRYSYLPPAFEQIEDVPIYRLPSIGPGPLGSLCFFVFVLFFLLRFGRQAIYHAHGIGTPAWIAVLAAIFFRGKSIVKLRSGIEMYQSRRQSALGQWRLNQQFKHANRLIVVNKSMIDTLVAWGVKRERVFFFPNAIDTTVFTCKPDMMSQDHALLDFDVTGKNIFIYVGRLAYWKGVDTLIAAWAKLPMVIRETSYLLIVGDGPERESLEKQAATSDVVETVHFLGKRSDVLHLLWRSDVFLLPSRTEGLSNAMVEAMACGLPVVCTAVGGALDWVTEKENGVIVAIENSDSLCQGIEWMWQNQLRWPNMGTAAHQTIETHLSWDNVIHKIEQLYKTIH